MTQYFASNEIIANFADKLHSRAMQTIQRHIILPKIFGPILMLALILTIFCGCHRRVDPQLAKADSLMEEHPDSALAILEGYSMSENATDYDRALYGMLLTQARYKNFIDETDDSLINASAEYFINNDDKEAAARSLFHAGMIQLNAGKFGEAALSFTKGLDIAREGKYHIWEGQCAYGLCTLYGELHNASYQVNYANQMLKAFQNTSNKKWTTYSKLVLSRAYNNNCHYEKSISLSDELIKDKFAQQDTLISSETYQLRGGTLFACGKYRESIDNYSKAYHLNSSSLSEKDYRNLEISLYEIYGDTVPENLKWIIENVKSLPQSQNAFSIFVLEDNYKAAYESLVRYKNEQDSVLSEIFSNNVAESVSQYEKMQEQIEKEKVRNERIIYIFAILLGMVLSFTIYLRLRERMHREISIRLKTEADMESLRTDFQIQLENALNLAQTVSNEIEEKTDTDFVRIIRQRYAEANSLCDDYYQGRYNKGEKETISIEINKIVKSFTERSSLKKIEEYVNDNMNGIYANFLNDFFNLSEENKRLFLYLLLGFNSRSIAVILGQSTSAIYNKKSRLKAKISNSDALRKNDYIQIF